MRSSRRFGDDQHGPSRHPLRAEVVWRYVPRAASICVQWNGSGPSCPPRLAVPRRKPSINADACYVADDPAPAPGGRYRRQRGEQSRESLPSLGRRGETLDPPPLRTIDTYLSIRRHVDQPCPDRQPQFYPPIILVTHDVVEGNRYTADRDQT